MTTKRRGKDGGVRFELPESGLASDILAAYERQQGAAAEAVGTHAAAELEPATPAAWSGRESVFAFADTLDQRAEADARPIERPDSWVTFTLAGETYGLPVSHVQEILRITTITRVPHAPVPIRGITNLRGRVLAVVDLRVRLGLPAIAVGPESRILVTEARGRSIGLLVDAARHVLKLLPSAIQPPPADIVTERSDFFQGVYHLEHELAILLDVERVLLVEGDRALAS